MKKIKFLYHGSPHKGIEEIKPQNKVYRTEEDGLIYATPNIDLASVFLISGKVHHGCGIFGKTRYTWIMADRDEFIKNDNGGHIYVLLSKTFEKNPKSVLGEEEYVSTASIKPAKIIEYPSSLDAMIENGVQVYFISQETYRNIQKSKDHGYSIFHSLESENQKRGLSIKKI